MRHLVLTARALSTSIVILCCVLPAHTAAAAGIELLTPVGSGAIRGPDLAVARSRLVHINRESLYQLTEHLPCPLEFSLFDDLKWTVLVEHSAWTGLNARTWSGRVVDEPLSSVVLVEAQGSFAASIHLRSGALYELRPAAEGLCVVSEIDPALSERCGGLRPDPSSPSPAPQRDAPSAQAQADPPALPPPGCDDGSIIDIMIVYTPAARQSAGGTAAINALANLAVSDANAAFDRSLIHTHLRLVHTHEVNYTETNDPDLDSACLVLHDDNCLEEVHALRDQYGADCVSLWLNSYGTAGFGYFPHPSLKPIGASGFTFMGWQGASGLTLAHEVGHNLWCAHDHATHDANEPNDVPFADYSFGYREPGNAWHDIMAYPPGEMLPYFANPAINWPGPNPPHPGPMGVPAGLPGAADLALTINQTRVIVANFRPTAIPGLPSVLYVRRAASAGGDGLSWATALQDLQAAMCTAAGSNSAVKEIWVAAGTYKPDRGNNQRSSTFQLSNNLAIYGGFAGTESQRFQRNPEANVCILSGDIGTAGVDSDNTLHVLTGTGTDATAILDGFTITGGYADGSDNGDDGGGGLLNFPGGSPSLANCTFVANTAAHYGGAVYDHQGAGPTFNNCRFSGNVTSGVAWPNGGGAIFNSDSSNPVLQGCTFSGNSGNIGGALGSVNSCNTLMSLCAFTQNLATGTNGEGGAVYCYNQCSSQLTGCTFADNTAKTGGGLYHFGSSLTLIDCTVIGNTATGDGGGSYNYAGTQITATRCLFANNTGGFGGAMTTLFDSPAVLLDCTFRKNTANTDAGGLGTYSNSPATLINCLFVGNTGYGVGAIGNWFSSNASITNCTIVGNSGTSWIGGVYSYQASPTLANTILWDNQFGGAATEQAQLFTDQGTTTIHHCMVMGWTGALNGVANNGSAPSFLNARGADNIYGTADDDLRLAGGSAAIDTGDNNAIPSGAVDDLDGGPRILGAAVDRGAYESVPVLPGDFDRDGDVDGDDLALFQNCLSGPKIPRLSGCQPADLDGDNDVDQVDFGRFQRCFSGRDKAADPSCNS